jgi:putative protein-disulfide isomerase
MAMQLATHGGDTAHGRADGLGLPEPCALYVFDAYCGWCWGASPLIQELASAWAPGVPVIVISGGLFVGPRSARIDTYPHIPGANRRIAELTGVRFGDRYEELLRDGSLVLDSLGAATAFAALRVQAPSRAVVLAHRLQEAFYVHGRSLSEPATVIHLAHQEGLDAERVGQDLESGRAREWALQDFEMARALGVSSYPTLLAIRSGQVTQLPCSGTSASAITAAVDWPIGTPPSAHHQRPT